MLLKRLTARGWRACRCTAAAPKWHVSMPGASSQPSHPERLETCVASLSLCASRSWTPGWPRWTKRPRGRAGLILPRLWERLLSAPTPCLSASGCAYVSHTDRRPHPTAAHPTLLFAPHLRSRGKPFWPALRRGAPISAVPCHRTAISSL